MSSKEGSWTHKKGSEPTQRGLNTPRHSPGWQERGQESVPSWVLRSGLRHGMVRWRQGRMEEEIMTLLVA